MACEHWHAKKPESWHGFAKGTRIEDTYPAYGGEAIGTVCGGDAKYIYMIRDDGKPGTGPNRKWRTDPADAKHI